MASNMAEIRKVVYKSVEDNLTSDGANVRLLNIGNNAVYELTVTQNNQNSAKLIVSNGKLISATQIAGNLVIGEASVPTDKEGVYANTLYLAEGNDSNRIQKNDTIKTHVDVIKDPDVELQFNLASDSSYSSYTKTEYILENGIDFYPNTVTINAPSGIDFADVAFKLNDVYLDASNISANVTGNLLISPTVSGDSESDLSVSIQSSNFSVSSGNIVSNATNVTSDAVTVIASATNSTTITSPVYDLASTNSVNIVTPDFDLNSNSIILADGNQSAYLNLNSNAGIKTSTTTVDSFIVSSGTSDLSSTSTTDIKSTGKMTVSSGNVLDVDASSNLTIDSKINIALNAPDIYSNSTNLDVNTSDISLSSANLVDIDAKAIDIDANSTVDLDATGAIGINSSTNISSTTPKVRVTTSSSTDLVSAVVNINSNTVKISNNFVTNDYAQSNYVVFATNSANFKTANVTVNSLNATTATTNLSSTSTTDIKSTGKMTVSSGNVLDVDATSDITIDSGTNINLTSTNLKTTATNYNPTITNINLVTDSFVANSKTNNNSRYFTFGYSSAPIININANTTMNYVSVPNGRTITFGWNEVIKDYSTWDALTSTKPILIDLGAKITATNGTVTEYNRAIRGIDALEANAISTNHVSVLVNGEFTLGDNVSVKIPGFFEGTTSANGILSRYTAGNFLAAAQYNSNTAVTGGSGDYTTPYSVVFLTTTGVNNTTDSQGSELYIGTTFGTKDPSSLSDLSSDTIISYLESSASGNYTKINRDAVQAANAIFTYGSFSTKLTSGTAFYSSGTSNLESTVQINGETTVSNSLTVSGITSLKSNLTVAKLIDAQSGINTTYLNTNNTVNINSGKVYLYPNGDISTSGKITAKAGLDTTFVNANSTIYTSSTISSTGAITSNTSVNVYDATNNKTTISLYSNGDLTAAGLATVGSLLVNGKLTINGSVDQQTVTNLNVSDILIELGAGTSTTPETVAVIRRVNGSTSIHGYFINSAGNFNIGTATISNDTGALSSLSVKEVMVNGGSNTADAPTVATITSNQVQATKYTIEKSVPANANFTDSYVSNASYYSTNGAIILSQSQTGESGTAHTSAVTVIITAADNNAFGIMNNGSQTFVGTKTFTSTISGNIASGAVQDSDTNAYFITGVNTAGSAACYSTSLYFTGKSATLTVPTAKVTTYKTSHWIISEDSSNLTFAYNSTGA